MAINHFEEISKKTEAIYAVLNNIKQDTLSASLYSGNSGISLFKYHYIKNKNLTSHFNLFTNDLQLIAENYLQLIPHSFCNGKAGVNWLFSYLKREGALAKKSASHFTSFNLDLSYSSLEFLRNGNHDYLYGSIGIAYYLLSESFTNKADFFNLYFTELEKQRISYKNFLIFKEFKFDNNLENEDCINLSLSHGIISILKFCIQSYNLNIQKKRSEKIAFSIVEFLIHNKNLTNTYSIYSTKININSSKENKSRLAWCYGDLSIAYILHQYAKTFSNNNVKEIASEILAHTLKRKESPSQSGVYDGGLCHGSAGIAYIYYKLWLDTNENIYQEASNYWTYKTLEFSNFPEGPAGFMKYSNSKSKYEPSFGFLEGISGIGLVLNTLITKDHYWDDCIMLN